MKVWILVAIALLLLVVALWSEGFEATASIKGPPYDAAEKIRIFGMVSNADQALLRAKAVGELADPAASEDKIKETAGGYLTPVVGEFFVQKFKPAAQPLTQADTDAFVEARPASELKEIEKRILKVYFVDQQGVGTSGSSGYANILASLGQNAGYLVSSPTGPAAGATGPVAGSVAPTLPAPNPAVYPPTGYSPEEVARILSLVPEADKQAIRASLADASNPANMSAEDMFRMFVAGAVARFYVKVYSTKSTPVTEGDIDSYLQSEERSQVPPELTPQIRNLLKAYFLNQAPPTAGPTGAVEGPTPSGGATALQGVPTETGGSTSRLGTTFTTATKNNLFGPAFTSFGDSPAPVGEDSSKFTSYPQVLGGISDKKSTRVVPGAGIVGGGRGSSGLPSAESLGATEQSQFFPFSRTPGDMDLIPDPYRVAQTFSTASYSSKTEPVPFLSDFSAFQK